MGQVPIHHYLLIGSGALARHLKFYLSQLIILSQQQSPESNPSFEVSTWNRKEHTIEDLNKKLSVCSHVLLAISDSAIANFHSTHQQFSSETTKWIHFSGASHFEKIISAHPLMSFGPDLYDFSVYKKIHFVISEISNLKELFPFMENSFSILPPEKKPLYHSLCVLGGNMPILLWEKMNTELTQLGIPPQTTDLYLETILRNYLNHREKAFTGPLKRKDLTTIANNLLALKSDPYQKVYAAFVDSQNIKIEDHSLDTDLKYKISTENLRDL